MTDENALIQRIAQLEGVLLNIQVILVGIAALLAGCAMYALAAIEGGQQISRDVPFLVGFGSFAAVAVALRPRSSRRRKA